MEKGMNRIAFRIGIIVQDRFRMIGRCILARSIAHQYLIISRRLVHYDTECRLVVSDVILGALQ